MLQFCAPLEHSSRPETGSLHRSERYRCACTPPVSAVLGVGLLLHGNVEHPGQAKVRLAWEAPGTAFACRPRPARRRRTAARGCPSCSRQFDDRDNRMSPSHAAKDGSDGGAMSRRRSCREGKHERPRGEIAVGGDRPELRRAESGARDAVLSGLFAAMAGVLRLGFTGSVYSDVGQHYLFRPSPQ